MMSLSRTAVLILCLPTAFACTRAGGDALEIPDTSGNYVARLTGARSGVRVPFVSDDVSVTIARRNDSAIGAIQVFHGDWMDPSFSEAFVQTSWVRDRAFRLAIASTASQQQSSIIHIWNRSSTMIPCLFVAAADVLLIPDLGPGARERFGVTAPPGSEQMWLEATAFTASGGIAVPRQRASFRRGRPHGPISFTVVITDDGLELAASQSFP